VKSRYGVGAHEAAASYGIGIVAKNSKAGVAETRRRRRQLMAWRIAWRRKRRLASKWRRYRRKTAK
jgi:hypothetical protein